MSLQTMSGVEKHNYLLEETQGLRVFLNGIVFGEQRTRQNFCKRLIRLELLCVIQLSEL
jgi:hypothetical protein